MFAFCLLSGSVFGLLTAPGLIVLHLGEKKPFADFKPAKTVLLDFLGAAVRWGLGSIFFSLSCGCARMEAQSRLQYSQMSSFHSTLFERCAAHTVHIRQPGAYGPPHCAIL